MKQLSAVVLFIVLAGYTVPAPAGNTIPDVMGHLNAVRGTGGDGAGRASSLASYTVLPGWPVQVPYHSHEGGIFADIDLDSELEIIYHIGQTLHRPDRRFLGRTAVFHQYRTHIQSFFRI